CGEVQIMISRFLCYFVLVAVALCAPLGCSSGPKLVKVQGVVTLDGQPLPGATVSFVPVGEGPTANGLTDKEGNFQLGTYSTSDGAAPGQYKVIVTKEYGQATTINPSAGPESMKDMFMKKTPEGKKAMAEERKKAGPSVVPAIYSDQKRTPLKETVPTS